MAATTLKAKAAAGDTSASGVATAPPAPARIAGTASMAAHASRPHVTKSSIAITVDTSVSNLRCPYGWSASGGRAANRMATSPNTLAAPSNSESKPPAPSARLPDCHAAASLTAAAARLSPRVRSRTRAIALARSAGSSGTTMLGGGAAAGSVSDMRQ